MNSSPVLKPLTNTYRKRKGRLIGCRFEARMKAVILRALARATQEAGEGILEFLLALSQCRLQLSEIHFAEVQSAAQSRGVRPQKLQAAIDFVIESQSASQLRRPRMPF